MAHDCAAGGSAAELARKCCVLAVGGCCKATAGRKSYSQREQQDSMLTATPADLPSSRSITKHEHSCSEHRPCLI